MDMRQVIGHSVGTWVAYEFLMAARAACLPEPRAAFLSAMPGAGPAARAAPLARAARPVRGAVYGAQQSIAGLMLRVAGMRATLLTSVVCSPLE